MNYGYKCAECGEFHEELILTGPSSANQYCASRLCRKCFHILVAAKKKEREENGSSRTKE